MRGRYLAALLVMSGLILAACSPEAAPWLPTPTSEPARAPEGQVVPVGDSSAAVEPDVRYTLLTGAGTGKLVFVGQGGAMDGVENPVLTADPGDTVEITLVNADNILHDIVIDEFGVHSGQIQSPDSKVTVTFKVGEAGEYDYYCSLPGHRQAGMQGVLRVGEPAAPVAAVAPPIVRNPADLPGPIGDRPPTTVKVDLLAQEVEGQLADGATFTYYTFNGQVPGPMIRVRVGDTVELRLTNATSSTLSHSIDLHAVNGPGGGAVYTQTAPGETHAFSFKTLSPGVFVYHCATPSVAHHIAMGMYGLIVVEPEGGLPPVDKEFYIMQGEIYTQRPFGTQGHLDFSMQKMLAETPEYFVFNGAAGGLTSEENALYADVGDTVRLFVGVGGPNFTSSFHVIGEIFDRVYPFGSFTSPNLTDVQTISIAPGGAWVVEFEINVPGRYILVDHALSRLERGLVGFLFAEGPDAPEIFQEIEP